MGFPKGSDVMLPFGRRSANLFAQAKSNQETISVACGRDVEKRNFSMVKYAVLKRSVSFFQISFYGLGTILGVGIYVLISKVAATSLMYAPIAFAIAALIAAFTGLSYGELAGRYPKSAGEAVYVKEALRWRSLANITGWLVVLTGIVSAATLSRGFVGYLHLFIQMPDWVAISLIILALGALASWGIREAVWVAVFITLIEVGGLLFVLYVAGDSLQTLPERLPELIPPMDWKTWTTILSGAFLAFYAFIGFEDMVNLAEEVHSPQRSLPYGIIIALSVATVLYILVALVAVLALPIKELAQSTAPLALIVQKQGGVSSQFMGVVSLIAVLNGALVQIIMASRVVYGLGKQKGVPKIFSKIHPERQTPIFATILITLTTLVLALWFPLTTLARSTSTIILVVFSLVNLSLIVVKFRKLVPVHDDGVRFPMIIPIIGFLSCVAFLGFQGYQTFFNS